MQILILVVNDNKKKYSSTFGMKTTVDTSAFLKYRYEKLVPERIVQLKEALARKDFQKFSEITMQDSNSFHACCLDTYPPLMYMNDVSHTIVAMVHSYNDFCGQNKVLLNFTMT